MRLGTWSSSDHPLHPLLCLNASTMSAIQGRVEEVAFTLHSHSSSSSPSILKQRRHSIFRQLCVVKLYRFYFWQIYAEYSMSSVRVMFFYRNIQCASLLLFWQRGSDRANVVNMPFLLEARPFSSGDKFHHWVFQSFHKIGFARRTSKKKKKHYEYEQC